ncbi:MAG: hypothetical protein JWP61_621 [Friedmanniella sp.]|nr:hypothetical protein [Friedmanniella sp.]
MTASMTPYLTFRGGAREALDRYREIFGGTVVISTFGEFGMADTPLADQVMHGQLEAPNGFVLMASDVPDGMDHTPGNSISVCLSGSELEELRGFFAGLAEGGTVSTPLEKQMWGDEYGACVDRFGVPWMVNIALPKE